MRAVLFDVDGTWVDTSYVHAVCWAQALRQHGHLVPMAQIHRAVGLGADKILKHLLGEGHDSEHDHAIVAAHDTLFAEWSDRARALPKAADLLRFCAGSGQTVVLATSGTDLKALRALLDADDVIRPAPPRRRRSQQARHRHPRGGAGPRQTTADEAVFVRDAIWDMIAARRLHMRCIGLECGEISAEELRQAGATEVWQDPADLLTHVGKSLLAPR